MFDISTMKMAAEHVDNLTKHFMVEGQDGRADGCRVASKMLFEMARIEAEKKDRPYFEIIMAATPENIQMMKELDSLALNPSSDFIADKGALRT